MSDEVEDDDALAESQASDPVLPAVDHHSPATSLPFPIVAIGASAGGIEALQEFFGALSGTTGAAFVVVLHLAPDPPSLLAEILQRATSMNVRQVEDEIAVEPDHVYVIAPGKSLVLARGALRSTTRHEARGRHHPVDLFLRSLAEEMGHKAVGVILSGSGDDGTLGMQEIKAAGGITFAQDSTAAHAGMPGNATRANCIDFVLAPADIAREIERISSHPYVHPRAEGEPPPRKDPAILRVLELIRHVIGVDFSNYKYNTMQRRITRRMVLHKLEFVDDYVTRLVNDPAEVAALHQDILINVTSFFRNPEAYAVLKTTVFPSLTEDRSRHEPVRAWALGCSTGEEAYSLAMAFTEYLEESGRRGALQIFATDLNGTGIDRARAGIYPKSITQDVSPERLRRFFVESDGSYRVSKPIRDMCVFARQNVLSDPPFSRIDLIACRNMLIYFEPVLQQKLIPLLHYAMQPDGYLWLGTSETIGSHRTLFELVDPRNKLYRRKPSTQAQARLPVVTAGERGRDRPRTSAGRGSQAVTIDPLREVDRLVLARYAPAGVVLDSELGIVQFRGDTTPYLQMPSGKATLSLLKMLREGLLVGVRGAVHRAKREEIAVREEGLRVQSGGVHRDVDVVVLPLRGAGIPKGTLLLLFEEQTQSLIARTRQSETHLHATADLQREGQDSDETQLARLKQELTATREYLQSAIEQQEAANEGLQSANEEVQSSNEELQSINEELETSKEEIQSTNEELSTVNDELQNRNLELSQSNNDLTNLLSSVQMPIVMVGSDLRIRRFTPAAEKLFKLIPADVGRPMGDIKFNLEVSDLEDLVVATIDSVTTHEREVQDKSGSWHLLRIRPYRTMENKIEGAVLLLVDIDRIKSAELAVRESEARFEVLADNATVLLWVHGLDGCVTVNREYMDLLGASSAELLRFDWMKWIHPDDRDAYMTEYLDAFARRELFVTVVRFRRADGAYRWMKSVGTPRILANGTFVGYVGCSYDITDLKDVETRLIESDRRKDEFLATLSHELRNPLAALLSAAQVLCMDELPETAVAFSKDVIERQSRNITRLVDDLLDVSRITHGKIALQIEPVDLRRSIEHAITATDYLRAEARQEVATRIADEPLYVSGDEARLDQVLVNLLANASKFTPEGGHAWITLEREVDSATARITVQDDGEGIDADALPRIFDLFVQASSRHGHSRAGVGIGLSLAKQIVELHGGTIEARSAGAGRGSQFIVRLALAAPRDSVKELSRSSAPPRNRPCQLLVLDDNVDAAELLRLRLEVAGHAVRVVHDGRAALAAVKNDWIPDIVLLDIGLPGDDGYQVARRLRSEGGLHEALLVAITGYGRQQDVDRAREAGIDHHFTKPVEMARLFALIDERMR